ncbi:hypothetical protein Lalb_Chr21g0311781 [Lupinus albus]|uniref:Uncharacterized protein n=1 Tax=Lupinus albus TaxID=3870 RepID=A0A6A4NQ04_LUPAL|nr:hypothetical protein Lalb_Chr21g0311781 [Lupinus albus]
MRLELLGPRTYQITQEGMRQTTLPIWTTSLGIWRIYSLVSCLVFLVVFVFTSVICLCTFLFVFELCNFNYDE